MHSIRAINTKSLILVITIFMIMASLGTGSQLRLHATRININEFSRYELQEILSQAEPQFLPRPQDFVQKNGKMHPNFSVSKNRQKPTVFQTKFATWDETNDQQNGGQIILEKKIDEDSKYYVKDRPFLHNFEVANEGSEDQLFIIGDSHGLKISYRFQQLFQQSIEDETTDSFPTVVSMIRRAYELGPNNYLLNFSLSMIKQHKPKRVLLACHWIVYFCRNKFGEPQYNYEKMDTNFKGFFQYVNEIQKLGVQVNVLSVDMHDRNYHPAYMSDFNGIIEENVKPVKLSEFKNRFKVLINKFEPVLRQMNVNVIDLSDNLCWENRCEVTTPLGYAIFIDENHFGKFYTRHWISAVDHLVQF